MNSLLNGKKIVIVGLGLIGGSVARGLSALNADMDIVGVGRNSLTLQNAVDDGSIASYSTDLKVACKDADLVLIAVPSLSVEQVLSDLKEVVTDNMVITDAASVKEVVVESAQRIFGRIPPGFVPGHPIAGSEHSGYEASFPELYRNRKVILIPLEASAPEAVSLVTALWEALGAEVVEMDVARHDAVLAATSHLPHLLAFALVDTLSQQGESEEIFRYAAGGFRDFTRIASSDPHMWRDIFLANGQATANVLDLYIEDLGRLRAAMLDKNAEVLMETFRRAKKSRDNFMAMLSDKEE